MSQTHADLGSRIQEEVRLLKPVPWAFEIHARMTHNIDGYAPPSKRAWGIPDADAALVPRSVSCRCTYSCSNVALYACHALGMSTRATAGYARAIAAHARAIAGYAWHCLPVCRSASAAPGASRPRAGARPGPRTSDARPGQWDRTRARRSRAARGSVAPPDHRRRPGSGPTQGKAFAEQDSTRATFTRCACAQSPGYAHAQGPAS